MSRLLHALLVAAVAGLAIGAGPVAGASDGQQPAGNESGPTPLGPSAAVAARPQPDEADPLAQRRAPGPPAQPRPAQARPAPPATAPSGGAPAQPVQTPAPPPTAPPAAPPTTAPAPYTGLGGGVSGPSGTLVMFGDMGPVFALPPPPSPNGAPAPIAPQAFGRAIAAKGKEVLPWVRADKMAENMSPVPQDRVFFTFNYFNNVNYAINGRIGSPYSNMQIQRYQLGLEKTFWDGNASIGFRDTLNTMSANSLVRGLGGTSSALGDLNVFTKFVLWQSWEEAGPRGTGAYPFAPGQANGGLISAGLSLNFPTGPGAFAGSPGSTSFRDTQLQPFVGYFWSRNRVYLLGFEEINVPLDPNDVTMLFTDIGTGYFYYKSPDPNSFLSAASATFEVHVNDPLNHRHPYSVTDLAGTADVLDFTYGTSLFLGQRALFSTAIVTPVTGPRPFNFEVLALFNIYFGKSTRAQRASSPLNMGN